MNRVKEFESKEMLTVAAADLIIRLAHDCIKHYGKFSIALSGGSTPAALFKLLAQPLYAAQIEWKHVFIFWGDERFVPGDSEENNSHNAKLLLLDHVPVPAKNIFVIPVQLAPAEAAASYEVTLKLFFKSDLPRFDLILLGMGDNGHTASLFPHTTILHETNAIVKEVYVEEVKMYRISFTAGLINNAGRILFLVAGKDKAPMLHTILHGDKDIENYPAQMIHNAEWFVNIA